MPDTACHKTIVIDRTLPEIRGSLLKMSRLDILDLCWMLMNVGADLVETDSELLGKMGRLPEGLAFLLRAFSLSDVEACRKFGIKHCVIRRTLLEQSGTAEIIKKNGLFAVLEVRVNSIGGIRRLEGLRELKNFDAVSCIRISGLERLDSPEWLQTMDYIRKVLNRKIDICPDNRFSMGNAIALEAAANGTDYVTASFSGFGYGRSYAALEVVLTSIKFQRTGARRINPDVLSVLCEQFTKCSRVKVAKHRPVIAGNPFGGRFAGKPGNLIIVRELIDA